MTLLGRKTAEAVSQLDIAKLVRQHYDQVFRFCSVRVGYHHAGDAAQETFITAQKSLSRFRGESKPLTWLIGIALNECRRVNRNLKRDHVSLEFSSVESGENNLINRATLQKAMETLTDEHREVVVLHEIDGFTYAEISEILGIPDGTVKSRLYHAFLNLRKQLNTSLEVN
jgi:RNA polymerase sigma-70 factor, ECF subfamily